MASMHAINGHGAIVTGAAGGIGSAAARKLASQGAGVICVDLHLDAAEAVAEALRSTGGKAVALAGDVTDPSLPERAVEAARDSFGRLDILVNNAGAAPEQVPLWEIELDDWQRVIAINLTSQYMMCKAVVPIMMDAGYGRILNVGSAAGMEGHVLSGGYSAAKAGVIAMTKTLGKELAKTGVIVNAIAPALIGTGFLAEITDSLKAELLARIPMGRVGQPDEVAEMISFLVSPAVTFSTGAVFDLSGGRATY
jgi:3-oxoacyl-[acyl-carrier protein] reductase